MQVAADREAIRRAGSLQFLLDIVAGKPAPVRDAAGRIVDWTDPPELPLRVSTATALVKKVLPDLQAQAIDLQTAGDGMIKIFLGDIPPPASIDDANVVEGHASGPKQLEDGRYCDEVLDLPTDPHCAPSPAEAALSSEEPNPTVNGRRRRGRA